MIPAGVGRVGVVFGQTEIGASLVDAGHLGDFAAGAETVREWAESLEHVDDGPGFFRFLVGRVAPGGLLMFSTPNQDLLPFDPAVYVHHRCHYGLRETLAFPESDGLIVRAWYGQDVYQLDGPTPTPLHPSRMELHERRPGQFTIVVAEKPSSR